MNPIQIVWMTTATTFLILTQQKENYVFNLKLRNPNEILFLIKLKFYKTYSFSCALYRDDFFLL